MNNRRRLIAATLATVVFVALTVTGCKLLSGPPTAVERKFFDFETNSVPKVTTVTNMVNQTNFFTVNTTNELNQIIPHVVEQLVSVPVTHDVTNYHDEIKWIPNANAAVVATTGGAITNAIAPGAGGIAAGILAGVFGMWGKLRGARQVSDQHEKTSGVLAQDVEAIREFIWTLPNGETYDDAIKQFMRAHQKETGVVQNVVDLLKNTVDETDAKGQLTEIQKIIASLGATPPKPNVPLTPANPPA